MSPSCQGMGKGVEAVIDRVLALEVLANPACQAACEPAIGAARTLPGWPPVALPLLVGSAFGLGEAVCVDLAVVCLLFFASADVIDDVQDGDARPAPLDDAGVAIAAGMALLFASQEALLGAFSRIEGPVKEDLAPIKNELLAAWGMAGATMSRGQLLDLAARGEPRDSLAEADYMACVAAKTGGSLALFASLGALAAGAAETLTTALQAWGRATGAGMQLASDLADALSPHSRDRQSQRPTLPVILAWKHLSPADRPLLLAAWRAEPGAPDLAFLITRSGAKTRVEARIRVYQATAMEVLDALEAPAMPGELADRLRAVTHSFVRPGNSLVL